MNPIWNLIAGSICLVIFMIDGTLLGLTWISFLNLFAAIVNYWVYIIVRTSKPLLKEVKDD